MPVVDKPEEFLLNSGLLYNINRTILHPLGLSLGVTLHDERNEDDPVDIILHQTEDPNGFAFQPEQLTHMEAQWQKYLSTQRPMLLAKAKRLGFIQQPVTPEAESAP